MVDLKQRCTASFKQGDHNEAGRLLPEIQEPQDIVTEFCLAGSKTTATNVTLLHLAAYHGWLDIIKTMKEYFKRNYTDSKGSTSLHYAAAGGSLAVIDYLITELDYDCTPNNDGALPLHIACHHGHLNVAKYFITEQNCDPNCRGQHGWTLLHNASQCGYMNIIQYLITELGCDPTIPNSNGALPLHIACLNGHLNTTKYFITEQNCDPNFLGQHGCTLLHYASQGGHMNIIQYLITKLGCHPIITNSNGDLPLHIACRTGHFNATKYFITEQNCDPNIRGQHGWTLLHYASEGGHMNIIHSLFTELGCDPTITNSNGALPLHIACRNGHLNATKYFITEQKCDPNCQDRYGWTLLHYASKGGHMNIIQYLITELCCDPTIPNNDGALPLHIACLTGHFDITKYFITEQNCDPNFLGQHGWTLLHYASKGGHMNIIQYLITELGCGPTTPNNNGALPLHIACANGHLNATKYFITEQKYNRNCRDKHGWTLLHYASQGGHMNIIQYLITELGCDPTIPNINGDLPLHIACANGHLNATKYFIIEQNCEPNCRGPLGLILLHYASQGSHMNIIQYLITELACDPTIPDNNGALPLHNACFNGHLNPTKYFITEQNCDPNYQDNDGWTPLRYASKGGHMNIIQYLITEMGCDPTIPDDNGALPLHIACLNGHLNATKYFITEQNCDPNCRSQHGWTLLHYASAGGHMNIIQYLVIELGCDPTTPSKAGSLPLHIACQYGHLNATKYFITEQNFNPNCRGELGWTPLHYACKRGHTHIVQWLFQSGRVDIMAKDYLLRSCLGIIDTRNHYELLKLFQPFIQAASSFPLHIISKTVVTGSSTVGKTTLSKVITERAKSYFNVIRFGNVEQVVNHTAGIVPSLVDSWEVGKMVLYDLAGHSEYHSSHFAVMEIVMQQSPATFINVIDLNNTDCEISKQLHYWLNFIDNATSKTSRKSCVIVVGSHADLLTNEQLKNKSDFILDLIQSRVRRQKFIGFVTVDCRKIDSKGIRQFISLLHKSHGIISARTPSISYYCHLLYAFLKSKPELMSTCTLQEIISAVAWDKDSPLSSETSILTELLASLSDKGVIIFIQNQQQPEKSWVVIDTEKLLKQINGILFAPTSFKEHHQIASSTGIVLTSALKQLFPQYNLEMLVGFLEKFEVCHRVNWSGSTTNLQSIETSSPSGDKEECFLFFPSLIDCCRPSSLPRESNFNFGWTICCRNPKHQSFTSRFLHVLLLRLAYTYPLADADNSVRSSHCSNKCIVWTNGITWENEEGIRTLVELIDYNQRVVVAMSHKTDSRPVECSKYRSAVSRLVLDLKQQLCPNVETDEYLISPSLLNNWSVADWCVSPSDNDLFPIENVAKSTLLHKPYIHSRAHSASDHFATKDVLQFEPYYQLSPSSVCELMDSSKADEIVSHSLLREVKSRCQLNQLERQTRSNLKKSIDQFSIFASRDPIVRLALLKFSMYTSSATYLQ